MAVDRDLNRSQAAQLQLAVVWPWFRNPWILTPLVGVSMLSVAGMGWFAWRSHKNRQESARLRKEALARAEQDRLGAEFARQLIRTQEAERSRLAHELHDSLGQELLLIRNTALLAGNGHGVGAGHGSDRSGPMTDIAERASRTIEELRNIAYALRPQELDRLGLVRALKVLCEEMAEAGGLTLVFSADPLNGSLAPEMEISLYRVVQEALSNVVHHARATTLSLRLSTSEDRLRITLRDNGVGFDASSRSSECSSLGLVGMAERIRLLGGGFSLTSRPQEGTVVDFWLPLRRPLSTEFSPNS
jgi:signal transduction histidine kinase